MINQQHYRRLALCILAGLTACPGMMNVGLCDDTPANMGLKLQIDHRVVGLNSCKICHRAQLPASRDAADQPPALEAIDQLVPDGTDDDWVRMNEFTVWGGRDKHRQAYAALLGEKARRMGQILRISEIHRDKRCLACHASYPVEQLRSDPEHPLLVPSDDVHHPGIFLGVSCEGCHGPAGDRLDGSGKGWEWEHIAKDRWRFKSAEHKAEFGFRDVRSSVARAQLCVSCHVGDAGEGKLVTHEMYAAGHPPLPAFEIETFIEMMPRHWQPLHAKNKKVRQEYLSRNGQVFHENEMARTKSMLIGALVAAGGTYGLTADLASENMLHQAVRPDGVSVPWPELSQFDCFACHHDLKDQSWRKGRNRLHVPGRPGLREWPLVLVSLAVEQSGASSNFDTSLDNLRKLLADRPFGDPDTVPAAARTVSEEAMRLARLLEEHPLTMDDAAKLRMKLAQLGAANQVDYDAARQLLWAFQVVDGELRPRNEGDPVAAGLQAVSELLYLNIRGDRPDESAGGPPSEDIRGVKFPVQYVDQAESLPRISGYDPERFRQGFQRILDTLEQEPAPAGLESPPSATSGGDS